MSKTRAFVVASLSCISLLLGTLYLLSSPIAGMASTHIDDVSQVKSVVENAVYMNQRLPIISDNEWAGLKSSGTYSMIKSRKVGEVSGIYTGNAMLQEGKVIDDGLEKMRSGNIRGIDGGSSNVVFDQVSVSGDSATVVAMVDVWSKFSVKDSTSRWHTFTPHNKIAVTATLTKDASGVWKIDGYQWNFVPGYEP